MANWWASSVAWTAMTAWAASAPHIVGNLRRQSAAPTVGNERAFRCTTPGTSGGTEPVWTLTKGGTTTDGTVVWTEVTGNNTYNTPTALSAPFARVDQAVALTWMASGGGDIMLVASNHVQNPTATSASHDLTLPGTATVKSSLIHFDETNATLTSKSGGQYNIPAGGSNGRKIILQGGFYDGGTANMAQGYAAGAIGTGGGATSVRNWNIYSTGGGNDGHLIGVSTGTQSNVKLENVGFRASTTASPISLRGLVEWNGGTIFDTGTVPSPAITTGGYKSDATIRGINASAVGTGKTLFGDSSFPHSIAISDSQIGAGATLASPANSLIGININVIRMDSAGATTRNEKYFGGSSLVTETTLIATAGANNGVTGYSWKIVTGTAVSPAFFFECFPVVAYNTTTGAAKSATIEGIWSSTVVPNDDEVFMALGHMGSAAAPLATFATSRQTNILAAGAALTASTVAWDSLITARSNSGARALGDLRKVASNPGRVFICTTAGTTAASEPAGYASAVDGGSVTDNTAVFRAMVRFKVVIASFTPQMAGYLYALPRVGNASTTVYISPKLAIA